eukprot:scaffold14163_cov115-Isochrysis_galbana.AAC.11
MRGNGQDRGHKQDGGGSRCTLTHSAAVQHSPGGRHSHIAIYHMQDASSWLASVACKYVRSLQDREGTMAMRTATSSGCLLWSRPRQDPP